MSETRRPTLNDLSDAIDKIAQLTSENTRLRALVGALAEALEANVSALAIWSAGKRPADIWKHTNKAKELGAAALAAIPTELRAETQDRRLSP